MPRIGGWRKFAAVGVVVVSGVAGLSACAATRGAASGCFPGPPTSLRTWERADSGIRTFRGSISSVVGSSAHPGHVYVSADVYGLYAGGGHPFVWRHVLAAAPDVDVVEGEHPESLYGLAWGLYRSVDGGRRWSRISCNFGFGRLAVSESDPSSLYQTGTPGDYPLNHLGGYYRSTDGGKTWSRSTVGATQYDGPELGAIAVDPANPNDVTVAPESGGIFRAKNGNDWAFTRLPGPTIPWNGQQVETLAFGAGPNPVLWAGTTSGAFRRMADGSWVRAGLRRHGITVFPDARVASVAFAILGYAGTGRTCVRRTTNNGKTWLPVKSLPCTVSSMSVAARDDAIYAWTLYRLYRSTDHGATWVRLPPLPVG